MLSSDGLLELNYLFNATEGLWQKVTIPRLLQKYFTSFTSHVPAVLICGNGTKTSTAAATATAFDGRKFKHDCCTLKCRKRDLLSLENIYTEPRKLFRATFTSRSGVF